jgi:hypothetical protein
LPQQRKPEYHSPRPAILFIEMTTMDDAQVVDLLEHILRRIKSEDDPPPVSDDALLLAAEKSFEGLLRTAHHLQDSASRLLASMAFLTAAAAAIYDVALDQLKPRGVSYLWPTGWFLGHMLCVSIGALFLMGVLWNPRWRKLRPSEPYDHTFFYFRDLDPSFRSAEDVRDRNHYQTQLLEAYIRERNEVARDGRQLTLMVQWGGLFLAAAFFFLLGLTSTLLMSRDPISLLPALLTIAMLCTVIGIGSFIRTDQQWAPQPSAWIGVASFLFLAAFVITSIWAAMAS